LSKNNNDNLAQDEKKWEPWWQGAYYTVPSNEYEHGEVKKRKPSDIP